MPNKTIYVKDSDRELWERAERLGGGSVSALLTEALRKYVEESELKERGMETIGLDLGHNDGTPRPVEFVGRWLLDPEPNETRTTEPGYDGGAFYGVALTKKGRLAIVSEHCNGGWGPELRTYDSFEKAEREGVPADILARAAANVGNGYVQKLDI